MSAKLASNRLWGICQATPWKCITRTRISLCTLRIVSFLYTQGHTASWKGKQNLENKDKRETHYCSHCLHWKCTLCIYYHFKNNIKTKLFKFSVSASETDNHLKEEAVSNDGLVSLGFSSLVGLDPQILTSLDSLR